MDYDMSLDDIIKINRDQRRKEQQQARARGGRGRGTRGNNRGVSRGGISRGRGVAVRARGTGFRGRGIGLRGRGTGFRGRGTGLRGRGIGNGGRGSSNVLVDARTQLSRQRPLVTTGTAVRGRGRGLRLNQRKTAVRGRGRGISSFLSSRQPGQTNLNRAKSPSTLTVAIENEGTVRGRGRGASAAAQRRRQKLLELKEIRETIKNMKPAARQTFVLNRSSFKTDSTEKPLNERFTALAPVLAPSPTTVPRGSTVFSGPSRGGRGLSSRGQRGRFYGRGRGNAGDRQVFNY